MTTVPDPPRATHDERNADADELPRMLDPQPSKSRDFATELLLKSPEKPRFQSTDRTPPATWPAPVDFMEPSRRQGSDL
jgi:hypothetical protein